MWLNAAYLSCFFGTGNQITRQDCKWAGRSSERKGRLPRIVKEGYEVVMKLCISTDTKEPMGIFSEGGGGYLGVEIVKRGVKSSVVGQGIGTCPGSHSE